MDTEIFTVETTYSINYKTSAPVPIPEIISSLKSTEKLLHRTPAFIEKAYDGIAILEVQVFVSTLQTGSLIEDFAVKYIFRGRENYEKQKEVIDKMISGGDALKLLVAAGMGAYITYGVMQSVGPSAPTNHVTAYNNNIVTIGGKVNLEADDITAILDAVTDKKKLAKESIDFIKPAKQDSNATIEITGINELTIDRGFVDETPDEYTPPTPAEKDVSYKNADIIIYASDRETSEKTWAGIVPGILDKRTKFILGEGVDPTKLHGRIRAKADIIITSRFIKSKKAYEAHHVLIEKTN